MDNIPNPNAKMLKKPVIKIMGKAIAIATKAIIPKITPHNAFS